MNSLESYELEATHYPVEFLGVFSALCIQNPEE